MYQLSLLQVHSTYLVHIFNKMSEHFPAVFAVTRPGILKFCEIGCFRLHSPRTVHSYSGALHLDPGGRVKNQRPSLDTCRHSHYVSVKIYIGASTHTMIDCTSLSYTDCQLCLLPQSFQSKFDGTAPFLSSLKSLEVVKISYLLK